MPRYDKCCCCFTAHTGAWILGFLGLLGSAFGIIGISVFWSQMSTYEARDETITGLFSGLLVLYVIFLAIEGLLVAGLIKKKPWMFLPHLVMRMFTLVVSLLAAIGYAIFAFVAGRYDIGLIILAIQVPLSALGFYFWDVVKSVYLDTKKLKASASNAEKGEKPISVISYEKNKNFAPSYIFITRFSPGSYL